MTVQITDMIFPVSVTVTVPKYPNVIKLTTNKTIAILLNIPLYLMDATLLLSNQGTINNIATAAIHLNILDGEGSLMIFKYLKTFFLNILFQIKMQDHMI